MALLEQLLDYTDNHAMVSAAAAAAALPDPVAILSVPRLLSSHAPHRDLGLVSDSTAASSSAASALSAQQQLQLGHQAAAAVTSAQGQPDQQTARPPQHEGERQQPC